jgi:hypothetical protein
VERELSLERACEILVPSNTGVKDWGRVGVARARRSDHTFIRSGRNTEDGMEDAGVVPILDEEKSRRVEWIR